jgi:anti-sigma B factor antagonist
MGGIPFNHPTETADMVRAVSDSLVSVRREPDGIVVVSLNGEHDLSSAERVREALHSAAEARAMVIDLTGTQFVDSSVLGVLVEGYRGAEAAGRGFSLAIGRDPQAAVRRVLELTGITTVVAAHETPQAAVTATREAWLEMVDDG